VQLLAPSVRTAAAVFSLSLLILMSWKLTIVCLISVPIVAIASVKFQRDSNRAYLTIRDRIGQNLSSLQEGITGVRVIQAFAREQAVGERFNESNRSLYDAHMESVRISVWYLPIVKFAGIATTAAVVGIGGWMVHQGEVSLGTVVAFVLLLTNLFEPVQQLSQLFNTVQAAAAGLNKLFGLLDTKTDLPERKGAVDLPEHGEVHVDSVWFSYSGTGEDEWVLRDVDLTIAPGERLALVGPTGAGKRRSSWSPASTTPSRGRSRSAVDLRDATARSLRDRIVVVPQEGFRSTARSDNGARAPTRPTPRSMRLAVVGGRALRTPPRRLRNRGAAAPDRRRAVPRRWRAAPPIRRCSCSTRRRRARPAPRRWSSGPWIALYRTVIVIAHRLSTAEGRSCRRRRHHDPRRVDRTPNCRSGRSARPLRQLAGWRPGSLRPCGCGSTKTSVRATACASTTALDVCVRSKTALPTSARGSGSATIRWRWQPRPGLDPQRALGRERRARLPG
jgi:ATP-binding cassette subfamily B protein